MVTTQQRIRVASCAFAAGSAGGLVNFLLPLLFAALHLFSHLGLDLHPSWDRRELYQKLIWGGLFGFAFLASTALCKRVPSWSVRAALFGCLPSFVQCLVVFPLQSLGVGGVRLGLLMPVLVLAFNTAGWSFPAYWLWTASGYDSLDEMDGFGFSPVSSLGS